MPWLFPWTAVHVTVFVWVSQALATSEHQSSQPVPNHCDSLPAHPCLTLWPGIAPNETVLTANETRTPDDGNGCGPARNAPCDHIHDVSHPTLTPFLVSNGTGAAIIVAPGDGMYRTRCADLDANTGGGYHNLAFSKEGLDVARMYNAIGVSAFVLKYRVPARPALQGLPKWWAPLQDAQRAVGLVRFNAAKYGINASRIGFTGSSAGGHLTAHLSTAYNTRIYPRMDAADDVSCRPDFSILQYPWMLLPNNKIPEWGAPYSLADELSGMTKDHPPSAFIQNMDDTTAPPQGTLAYAQKLVAVGSSSKPVIHIYNKGGHGYGICQGLSVWLEVCDWPKVAQRFLQDLGMALGWPPSSADSHPNQQLEQGCAHR